MWAPRVLAACAVLSMVLTVFHAQMSQTGPSPALHYTFTTLSTCGHGASAEDIPPPHPGARAVYALATALALPVALAASSLLFTAALSALPARLTLSPLALLLLSLAAVSTLLAWAAPLHAAPVHALYSAWMVGSTIGLGEPDTLPGSLLASAALAPALLLAPLFVGYAVHALTWPIYARIASWFTAPPVHHASAHQSQQDTTPPQAPDPSPDPDPGAYALADNLAALGAVLATAAGALAVGLWLLESMPLADGLYLAFMCFSTVGYGDLTPADSLASSRLFLAVVSAFGLGLMGLVAHRVVLTQLRIVSWLLARNVASEPRTVATAAYVSAAVYLGLGAVTFAAAQALSGDTAFDPWAAAVSPPSRAAVAHAASTSSRLLNGLYWAFISCTTIGYGDVVAVSTAARLITVAYLTVGLGLVDHALEHARDDVLSLLATPPPEPAAAPPLAPTRRSGRALWSTAISKVTASHLAQFHSPHAATLARASDPAAPSRPRPRPQLRDAAAVVALWMKKDKADTKKL